MKKGISLLLIITQVLFLNGQSLVVTGDVYFTGDLVTQIAHHLDVKNTSANTITIECQKTNLSLPSGAESFYCFAGNCYAASSTNPSSSTDLLPGQEISFANSDAAAHSGYYDAYGASGIGEVEYCFYDVHNPSDQTCVTISYDCSSAAHIIENTSDFTMGEFFPNPAREYTTINYKSGKNLHLEIIDILGKNIKGIHLSNIGTEDIYVGDLNKGVYFGNLVYNDKVIAIKKIIIK